METHEPKGDLTNVTPPTSLTEPERSALVQHFARRLAAHRNKAELFAQADFGRGERGDRSDGAKEAYDAEIERWAQVLLENAWAACQEPGGGQPGVLEGHALPTDSPYIAQDGVPGSDHCPTHPQRGYLCYLNRTISISFSTQCST